MDYTTKLSNNTNPSFKMTREEEIKQVAEKKAHEPSKLIHPYAKQNKTMSAYEIGFIEGAVWADAHPKKVEIPLKDIEDAAKEVISEDWLEWQNRFWNMIERNLRAKFIHKACKWLKENRNNVETEDNGISGWISDEFIEQFKKAMKK